MATAKAHEMSSKHLQVDLIACRDNIATEHNASSTTRGKQSHHDIVVARALECRAVECVKRSRPRYEVREDLGSHLIESGTTFKAQGLWMPLNT